MARALDVRQGNLLRLRFYPMIVSADCHHVAGCAALMLQGLVLSGVAPAQRVLKFIDPALIDQNVKTSICRSRLALSVPQDSRQ
jgi:hypothetical protein